MIVFDVYVLREMDGQRTDSFHPGLTTEEVQAMRLEQHMLPGKLVEFDALERRVRS